MDTKKSEMLTPETVARAIGCSPYYIEMCWTLQDMLWDDGKKFRVTIDCNPESGDFVMKRESITADEAAAPASAAQGRQETQPDLLETVKDAIQKATAAGDQGRRTLP